MNLKVLIVFIGALACLTTHSVVASKRELQEVPDDKGSRSGYTQWTSPIPSDNFPLIFSYLGLKNFLTLRRCCRTLHEMGKWNLDHVDLNQEKDRNFFLDLARSGAIGECKTILYDELEPFLDPDLDPKTYLISQPIVNYTFSDGSSSYLAPECATQIKFQELNNETLGQVCNPLLKAIQSCVHITNLTILLKDNDNFDTSLLIPIFTPDKSIHSLYFTSQRYQLPVQKVLESLVSLHSLSELRVDLVMKDKVYAHFLKGLALHPKISELSIYKRGFIKDVHLIADALLALIQNNTNLKILAIDHEDDANAAEFSAKLGPPLGEALEKNTTLKELDLGININDAFVTHLVKGLKHNTTLLTLSIDAHITTQCMPQWLEILSHNTTLQHLKLRFCYFCDQSCSYWKKILTDNTTLKYLDLSENFFTPASISKDWVSILEQNTTLEEINLSREDEGPSDEEKQAILARVKGGANRLIL